MGGPLDWAALIARYPVGTRIPPLVGSSVLIVEAVDDERLCVRQRLWRDCVTRGELDAAVALLGDRAPGAVAFSEELRRHLAAGPDVRTDCARGPTLTAVVLQDLGLLGGRG